MTTQGVSTIPPAAASTGAAATLQVMPMVNLQAMKARVKAIQDVMKGVMKQEVHFGVIPGTKKPSLYKAGAEILCQVFGLVAENVTRVVADDPEGEWSFTMSKKNYATQEETDVEGTCIGYFEVESTCTLYSNGVVVGRASARCNNRENKYRTLILWDVRNTIEQMAAKRAYVAAVRSTTGCSDIFTQDVEDFDAHSGNGSSGSHSGASRPAVNCLSPKQAEAVRTKGRGMGIHAAVIEFAIQNVSKAERQVFMDGLFAGKKEIFEPFAATLRARASEKPAEADGSTQPGSDAKPAAGGEA